MLPPAEITAEKLIEIIFFLFIYLFFYLLKLGSNEFVSSWLWDKSCSNNSICLCQWKNYYIDISCTNVRWQHGAAMGKSANLPYINIKIIQWIFFSSFSTSCSLRNASSSITFNLLLKLYLCKWKQLSWLTSPFILDTLLNLIKQTPHTVLRCEWLLLRENDRPETKGKRHLLEVSSEDTAIWHMIASNWIDALEHKCWQ